MPSYQTLRVRGRTFVVGDLHGCLSPLQSILQQVHFSAKNGDVCVLLGDLTDRGPDSLGCLALLDQPGIYSIQGNQLSRVDDAVMALHLLGIHPDIL
jgi:serine/threonine protein phosphatase 1